MYIFNIFVVIVKGYKKLNYRLQKNDSCLYCCEITWKAPLQQLHMVHDSVVDEQVHVVRTYL